MTQKIQFFPVLLWLCAFVCALYPINDWQLWLFSIAIALLYGWAFVSLSSKLKEGWIIPKSSVLYLAGAFWLWIAISVFWSEVRTVTLMSICMFSVMPLGFFAGIIGCEGSFFKRIAPFLAVIFALLSFWAVFQFFFLNAYFMGQARHPLADPSSLGGLLSMGLFGAMGWMCADRPPIERRGALALCILLVCGIMATVSRAPIFAFVPAFVVFYILLRPQVKAHGKQFVLLLISAVLFYGLMQTGIQKKFDLGQRLFGTTQFADANGNTERLHIWSSALEMIKDRPLLGTGYGTFFLYYPEYRSAGDQNGAMLAHNDPLQYFTELGLLGPLLFYGFAIACVWRTFRSLKNIDDPSDRVAVVALFCALIALVLESHVGFNLYNLSILMLTGIVLAAWFKATQKGVKDEVAVSTLPASLPAGLGKLLLAVPFVMIVWLLFGMTAGEHYANKASKDLFRENMLQFAHDINKAGRLSQGLNSRAYLLAVNVPMSILDFKKGKMDEKEQTELYEQVMDYMKRVLEINPRSASAYYYLGKVQTLVASKIIPANTPIPEEYYKKTLALDPAHIGARLALVKLYEAMQKPRGEQIAVLEPGINILYHTPLAMEYYGELTRLYLEDKNYGKVKIVLKKMSDFKKREIYSAARESTSLPQAIMGGDAALPALP